jgi:N-ethylmaleimide reductase
MSLVVLAPPRPANISVRRAQPVSLRRQYEEDEMDHGMKTDTLLEPARLGDLVLSNRVVMASMTRGRAANAELAPTDLHAEYYAQRASAGLILTEGIWVNRQAIGFINVPGIYSAAQVDGWKKVTEAVQHRGGRIFCQLAHSGAVSHPDFFDGGLPVAPSEINPGLKSFTPTGFKDTVVPRALSVSEIKQTIEDYGTASANAKSAGFDGAELHSATTYLLPEFLNSDLNLRTDDYGGSIPNRCRIVLEILDTMIDVWGPGRVGIKLNPTVTGVGNFNATQETKATYEYLVDQLNDKALAYLQLVNAQTDLSGTPVAELQDTIRYFRPRFRGTLIANGGYDFASATKLLGDGLADFVSFARPYIGNPDLVTRFEHGLPLQDSNRDTYYQGDAKGYTDYPRAESAGGG